MRATRREEIGTILFGTWVVIGLFLDGFAHENFRELESFWTPWHGVFYSGFIATAWWLTRMVLRRRPSAASLLEAIPPGYGLAIAGMALFAVGGVGDAIWHTLFGVEATIDALLSPTHILLFAGLILILTAPLRSWISGGGGSSWRDFTIPIVSMTLATSLVAFFFVYLWGPGVTWPYRIPFDPITESGEIAVMAGIGGAIVSSVILVGSALYLLRQRSAPFGAFAAMWGTTNLLIVLAFDRDPTAIVAGVAGGLAVDFMVRRVADHDLRLRAAGFVGPLVLWSVSFALQAATQGVAWQPELWGGAIAFSAFAGLSLAVLAGSVSDDPVETPARVSAGAAQ